MNELFIKLNEKPWNSTGNNWFPDVSVPRNYQNHIHYRNWFADQWLFLEITSVGYIKITNSIIATNSQNAAVPQKKNRLWTRVEIPGAAGDIKTRFVVRKKFKTSFTRAAE